jgi:hypothetical protein
MLILLFSPMLAYFLMLITIVILESIGVDVRTIDTLTLTVVYLQCIWIVQLIRVLKPKPKKEETN